MRRTNQPAMKKRSRHLLVDRWFVEALERRVLLTTNAWNNASGGDWDTPGNWSLGHVPTGSEDAAITLAGSYTVTHNTSASDAVRSLNSSRTIAFSAGSLTISGGVGSTITGTGALTVTGGTIQVAGAGTSLVANGTSTISDATLQANAGGMLTFQQATGLTRVNLSADAGGQLSFPAATSYATDGNTIQASGNVSKINLSALNTFTTVNNASAITASGGAEIDLAGQISGGLTLTLPDAASIFNVSGVTKLTGLTVSATAGTVNFPAVTSLTNVTLSAASRGQILFPAATSYATDGNTIQASGSVSKINLSALNTFTTVNNASAITASAGGEIDLTGQISGGLTLTLPDAASIFNVSGVTKLTGLTVSATAGTVNFPAVTSLTNVTLSAASRGQILFPAATSYATDGNTIQASGSVSKINLSALNTFTTVNNASAITASAGGEIDLTGQISGGLTMTLADATSTLNVSGVKTLANLTVSATAGTVNFPAVTSLTNVTLSAASGGQILFPAATSYATDGNTIQASGSVSKINLSALNTFTTVNNASAITASAGGEIDLTGQISGGLTMTLADATSTLNVSGVKTLANLTVSATAGTVNFPAVTSLTNVTLSAASGGQILFPAATSYATDGNTIQASGSVSKINLSALNTFTTVNNASAITASAGGEIDLAGAITGDTTLTQSDASMLNVTGVTSLQNTTMTAAAGATWLLPAAWHPTLGSGDTLTTTGGSQFIIQATLTLSGTVLIINTDSLSSLSISAGGKIDVGRSGMLINYVAGADPISAIRGYLANGYNGGAWNGTASGSIVSSNAAGNANHNTAVGYADSADSTGVNATPNSIRIAYTLSGDANLDGVVNSTDLQAVLNRFNLAAVWDTGDSTYDGIVNSGDLQNVLNNFNTSLGNQTAPVVAAAASAAANTTLAADSGAGDAGRPRSLVPVVQAAEPVTAIVRAPHSKPSKKWR